MPEFFDIRELVPQTIYAQYGKRSWWFIDPFAFEMLNKVRAFFGRPITVNNWHLGGNFHLSGFRPPNVKIGASLSQHKFGRAWDIKVKDMDAAEVARTILANEMLFFDMGVRVMEDPIYTKTWTHIDSRNTNLDHILIVRP